jgi:hypothetical protein
MVYRRGLADGLAGTDCAIGLSIRSILVMSPLTVGRIGCRSRTDRSIHPKPVRATIRSAAKRLWFNNALDLTVATWHRAAPAGQRGRSTDRLKVGMISPRPVTPINVALVLVCLATVGCAASYRDLRAPATYSATSVCGLLRNRDAFEGRQVTVVGTYRYGFEWQELYCLDCVIIGRIWVEWSDDESVARGLSGLPKHAGTANVVVAGIFESGGGYGHEGGYPAQIADAKPLRVEFVSRSDPHPNALTGRQRRKVCQH